MHGTMDLKKVWFYCRLDLLDDNLLKLFGRLKKLRYSNTLH